MAMGIQTNLASINAQRMLSRSNSGLATSMQRLSSGLRVNSAKDDAAGLAIAERMHSQIRGMNQAARNANDGISMLQTAEGAASKVTDMLQRMRELAVQSINFTNSDQDRQALQSEVQQLKLEIDRVGATTKFNGMYVFGQERQKVLGTDDKALQSTIDGLRDRWIGQAEQLIKNAYGIDGGGATIKIQTYTEAQFGTVAYVNSSTTGNGPGFNLSLHVDMADFNGSNYPDGGAAPAYNDRVIAHEMTHAVMATGESWGKIKSAGTTFNWFTEGAAEFIHGADDRFDNSTHQVDNMIAKLTKADLESWDSSTQDYAAGYLAVRFMHDKIKEAGGNGVQDVLQYLHNNNVTLDQAITAASSNAFTNLNDFYSQIDTAKSNSAAFQNDIGLDLTNEDTGAIGGLDADGGTVKTAKNVMQDAPAVATDFKLDWGNLLDPKGQGLGLSLGFQVGANAGDLVFANTGVINLGAMNLEDLSISDPMKATTALNRLDAAIDYVSATRGRLGAQMNRFENIVAVLNVSSENASAARSRIIDADFAVETANLSRSQILQQAGTAMVAQANQLPQNVLSLLR